ncbi:MAG: hypothetical protein H7235_06635 [Bdellovibrionaceae bacterium]|nr:hypothetical protein [Pseudobdellovibrionaceae bacterium]
MNFRTLSHIIYMVVIASTLTSCTDFMHGKKAQQETLKIELVDGSCSKDFKQQLKKISDSTATEAEINAVFECVDKYMSQFQNKVEGEAQADVYSAQDLLHITNRFFKDLELSKDVIKKITNFKKALIGGEVESVSRQEITEIREYFKNYLHPEVILLAPHIKALHMHSELNATYTDEALTAAIEQVRKSLKILVSKANFERSGYSYNDAKELLFGLDIINSTDQYLVETIDKIRQLLIGNNELKTNEDFQVFIDNAVDAYSLYLNSCAGQVKFEISSLYNVKKVVSFFDRIVDVLNTSYQYKKTGLISNRDLDEVLKVFIEKKIFPFDVQFATFQEFYKIALKRVFAQETSDFITEKQIETYYKESGLFKLEISYLETLDEKQTYKLADIQNTFKLYAEKSSFQAVSTKFKSDVRLQIATQWVDVNDDFYRAYPAMLKNNKYILSKTLTSESFSVLDLVRSFYIKMLGRQLLMGWGNGKTTPQFRNSNLNKEQMMDFTRDFKQFGIELKLNDPRSKNDGSKAFLAADLFGFTSDGNNMMSMSETFEYMHYLVAEGSGTTIQIQKDLAAAKCELQELDVFGNHWNPELCFMQNLKHNFSKYFVGKPGLIQYLTKLSDKEFLDYYTLLMDFSRFDMKNKSQKIETADIQTFVVLTSYIEAMFVKYDADASGTLSAQEIRSSFPKFKTFATDYSLKNAADSLKEWDESMLNICRSFYTKDDLVRESFVYMVLNKGTMPKMSDMNYVFCAGKGLFTFKNEIDRKSIIYTFLVLKDVLASDK